MWFILLSGGLLAASMTATASWAEEAEHGQAESPSGGETPAAPPDDEGTAAHLEEAAMEPGLQPADGPGGDAASADTVGRSEETGAEPDEGAAVRRRPDRSEPAFAPTVAEAARSVGPEFTGDVVRAASGVASILPVVSARDPSLAREAADLERILSLRMDRTADLERLDPSENLLGELAWNTSVRLEQARSHMSEGLRDYRSDDLEHALDGFQDALHRYGQALPAGFEMSEMGEAFLLLGATQLRLGQDHEARESFRGAAIFGPDQVVDRALFSSEITRAFELARHEVMRRRTGRVTIETTPPYAEVWVNGVYRGLSPVALDGLPVGPVYVMSLRRGHLPRVDTPITLAGEPIELSVALRDGPETSIYNRHAAAALAAAGGAPLEAPHEVRRLAEMLSVHRLLLGEVHRREDGRLFVELTAYDLRLDERMIHRSLALEGVSAADLVRRVDELISAISTPLADPVAIREALSEEIVDTSWPLGLTKNDWRVWAATGVGVAALAAGAVLVATMASADDSTDPKPPSNWPIIRIPR